MRRCKRKQAAGFTLLEVTLALALLAMMLTLLFAGLRLALRVWDAGSGKADAIDRLALSARFIRGDLASAFPWRFRGPEVRLAFEGDERAVSFVSARPSGAGGGGLAFVSLRLEGDSGGRAGRLVMRRAVAQADAADFKALDAAQPYVLLEGLESFRFSFFGATNDAQRPDWAEAWRDARRLPSHVRLEAKMAQAVMSDVVVSLVLGEEAGCPEAGIQRACPPRR